MAFIDAIALLNRLKRKRVIRDYAIIGAVAATAYMEPMFTEDLDIVVLVDTDEEFISTYQALGKVATGQAGMHLVMGEVPVQVFPTTMGEPYLDTLRHARLVRIGPLRTKVADIEHLIILYLKAYRERDKFRVVHLLPKADEGKLQALMRRFDGELTQRLQAVRGAGS